MRGAVPAPVEVDLNRTRTVGRKITTEATRKVSAKKRQDEIEWHESQTETKYCEIGPFSTFPPI